MMKVEFNPNITFSQLFVSNVYGSNFDNEPHISLLTVSREYKGKHILFYWDFNVILNLGWDKHPEVTDRKPNSNCKTNNSGIWFNRYWGWGGVGWHK